MQPERERRAPLRTLVPRSRAIASPCHARSRAPRIDVVGGCCLTNECRNKLVGKQDSVFLLAVGHVAIVNSVLLRDSSDVCARPTFAAVLAPDSHTQPPGSPRALLPRTGARIAIKTETKNQVYYIHASPQRHH